MLIWFGARLDASNLPPETDAGQSLAAASPTVIVDMETGDRVPHFSELDMTAPDTERQALIIRPMQWLERSRRYAVGVTRALAFADGTAVDPTPGFQALLDGETSDPRLARIADRYPDILAALEGAGVAKGELVLAFDYVTYSEEQHARDIVAMRDAAVDAMGDQAENLAYFVGDAIGDPAKGEDMIVTGTYSSPLFLEGGPDYDTYGTLHRGGDGLPEQRGFMTAPFTMVIPASAATDGPYPLLHYGHGLMGDSSEAASGWLRDFANAYGYVVFAHNWMGMSKPDLVTVINTLTNINDAPVTMDRLKQGMINAIALTRVARYQIAAEMPAYIDATQDVVYHGNSQGGIFGTTLMAWSPDLGRGVLGVGAGNYATMLQRSVDWPPYQLIVEGVLPEAIDQLLFVSAAQMLWDPVDGLPAAAHLGANAPYAGTPQKQILMQIGVADSQVANIASDIQARAMGIPYLGPDVVREVYGLTPVAAPQDSALTYWSYGCANMKTNDVVGPDNEVHEAVRRTPAAQRQMDTFLRTGVVAEECTGACECAPYDTSCPGDPGSTACD